MTGHMGVEIFGPYEQMETIRSAIIAAGKPFGMRQGGTKAYFSSVYESGWIAYPFPAIYTGEELRVYREWLPADSWEGNLQLAGSLQSSNVEDYYLTPWDLGYGRLLKFDRDFIGRTALEKMDKLPKRQKVTLVQQQRRRDTLAWRHQRQPREARWRALSDVGRAQWGLGQAACRAPCTDQDPCDRRSMPIPQVRAEASTRDDQFIDH